MPTTTASDDRLNEVAILARILGNENGSLPVNMARYILNREFSEDDKARMHDLAVRNQCDLLSADERRELDAFARAGTLLAILKSKARRALGIRVKNRTTT